MSREQTLRELEELQAQFGDMLRSPLARETGTLRAPVADYGESLCAAVSDGPTLSGRERLAVYHRQYWFRLFTLLQHEYLLTARLTGMWMFNGLASDYLRAHPPQHYDLQKVAPGFSTYLAQALRDQTEYAGVPRAALLEAALLDAAISRVFLAPDEPALDPARLGRALSGMRLRQSQSVALFCESRPLLALRRSAQREPDASRLPLPEPLAAPQHWLIQRKGHGHAFTRLSPDVHRLYALLAEHTLSDALGMLESECSAERRAQLPGLVQAWLKAGVQAQLWVAPT